MTPNGAASDPLRTHLSSSVPPVALLLRDLVHERTGIYFENERIDLMLEKLAPRSSARNCRTFLDYYYLLKYEDLGLEEWRRVMDAFSVQETYFWREFDQVRALVNHYVPKFFRENIRPLRIWSAACATGEEPYSLAMALQEAGWGGHPVEILGTDASEAALARARARFFRERSFRSLPPELREKYFDPLPEGYQLKPGVAPNVSFIWANLLDLTALPETAHVDVIFCRNVFIYFSPESIKRVLNAFALRLPPGGPLFVGASESLLRLTDSFELQEVAGAFVYVRKSAFSAL